MNTSTSGAAAFTEIYVWGNDEFGQLGLGHRYQQQNQDSDRSGHKVDE